MVCNKLFFFPLTVWIPAPGKRNHHHFSTLDNDFREINLTKVRLVSTLYGSFVLESKGKFLSIVPVFVQNEVLSSFFLLFDFSFQGHFLLS